jgi:hypothetical protein
VLAPVAHATNLATITEMSGRAAHSTLAGYANISRA